MHAHLRNTQTTQEKIKELETLTHVTITYECKFFVDIDIESGVTGEVLAMVQHNWLLYDDNNFEIIIFRKDDHDKKVSIPLKCLDCLFSL